MVGISFGLENNCLKNHNFVKKLVVSLWRQQLQSVSREENNVRWKIGHSFLLLCVLLDQKDLHLREAY